MTSAIDSDLVCMLITFLGAFLIVVSQTFAVYFVYCLVALSWLISRHIIEMKIREATQYDV